MGVQGVGKVKEKDLEMVATSKSTEFMSGTVYWAKVTGEPRLNYNKDGREWTFEFEPEEKYLDVLKKHGLTDRIKNKYEDRGPYLTLRKSELSRDGSPNIPIRLYNKDNEEWPADTLIGNGSKADVKLDIRDYGPGKKKGVYPAALRITELVPYVSSEFGGMDQGSDTPAPKPKKAPSLEPLDDELPF